MIVTTIDNILTPNFQNSSPEKVIAQLKVGQYFVFDSWATKLDAKEAIAMAKYFWVCV